MPSHLDFLSGAARSRNDGDRALIRVHGIGFLCFWVGYNRLGADAHPDGFSASRGSRTSSRGNRTGTQPKDSVLNELVLSGVGENPASMAHVHVDHLVFRI